MYLDEKFNLKKIAIEVLETMVGSFIMAISISLFLLPNHLSSGGVSGIATITYYLLNIPMGTMILIINVPLFLFAFFKIGRAFFIKSLLGTFFLSAFIDLLDRVKPVTEDRFLACVYGGIIIGLGTAILLKTNSSTGGSDLISYLTKKYKPNVKSGEIIMIFDIIVVLLNIIVFREIEIGLYSAIVIFLMGKVIDIVFEGVDFTKLIFIISDKGIEISKMIEQSVSRGTTGIYGKGMYTNKDKLIIMCAASRRDVSKIKKIIKIIDPYSFIIITNSREVVGLGFKE